MVLYGLDRDIARRMAAKYDPEKERQARQWIADVTGEELHEDVDFATLLHDGVLLCK